MYALFRIGLKETSLPGDDPVGNVAMFVDWVLVDIGSDFSICPASQSPPKCYTERTPEPTADTDPKPAAMPVSV